MTIEIEIIRRQVTRLPGGNVASAFRRAPDSETGSGVQPRRRILIVEDDYFVAMDIERCLIDANFDIVGIAASADEAIDLAGAHRPHLILMDIRLGGFRDGVEAATEILSKNGIRCIFVSAFVDPPTRRRAAASNPLGWLEKPFKREDLLRAIARAFGESD
jgi:DNA-binding NarL/FixJ family response regulator